VERVDATLIDRPARGDERLRRDLTPENAAPGLVEAHAAEDVLLDSFEFEQVEKLRRLWGHAETVHSGGHA